MTGPKFSVSHSPYIMAKETSRTTPEDLVGHLEQWDTLLSDFRFVIRS